VVRGDVKADCVAGIGREGPHGVVDYSQAPQCVRRVVVDDRDEPIHAGDVDDPRTVLSKIVRSPPPPWMLTSPPTLNSVSRTVVALSAIRLPPRA
jgi:hypothetical protein